MCGSSSGEWLFMACVVGVIGWAVIEAVLWLFSHLTFSWN